MKISDLLRALRSRVEDQRILRQKEDEIIRLNNTIDNLLRKQAEYHSQHVENHSQHIETREMELRREFDAILQGKDREIEQVKNKYKNFWQVYEELMQCKVELEKLRVNIMAKAQLVQGYDQESIKCMNGMVDEIDTFTRHMKALGERSQKLIPER